MSMQIPANYPGDAAFTRTLEELRCPMPLHQVKTFLLGCIGATNVPPIGVVFSTLWGEEPPAFESEEQVSAFVDSVFGLWNQLAAHQAKERFRLSRTTELQSWDGVLRHAAIRQEEILGFIRGLDRGQTDVDELSPQAHKAMEALAMGSRFLEEYDRLVREGKETGKESLRETEHILLKLDEVLEDAIATILAAQQSAREKALGLSGSTRRGRVVQRVPGRNDPCPCGSGRKYKQCCGKH